jgi:pantetheine-phosphate adenylyltransferase
MKTALYPGTFDPITKGHLDIIKRALKLFDKVIVAVASNDEKKPMFSCECRKKMVKKATKNLKNVEVISFSNLTVELAQEQNTNILIRGLRAVSDFEYELQLGYLNNSLDSDIETIYLMPRLKNAFIRLVYEIGISSYSFEKTLNYIFEQNLQYVINNYSKNVLITEDELQKTLHIIDKYVIMSKTDTKGKITYVSDAFCQISGYKKEELVGKPHNIVRHPDMKSAIFEDMWDTIKAGHIWHGEVKNKKKDGGHYWVYATIEPIYDKQNNIVGYTSVRQDITSKKEVEAQQGVIIEQSKSAAMGEMISMIAHQWRQPLQAVSILIQKLPLTKMIDGEISDEVLDQVVDDVGTQLDYMSKTIDDFRDFFRPDKAKETILVSKLVDKARDFLAYMLKVDSIDFKIIPKDDIEIQIHINEVVQVLINIIKNARDAMIEKNTQNRYIHITHYSHNNNAIIEIADNAGGIPEQIIEKIFDPYFSTKTNKNGTGLGLYMSRTIIEQHSNGVLSVHNFEDGAIFKIVLPTK